METPRHCDQPMHPLHTVGARVEWECQSQCGWCVWTGPVGVLKRYVSPSARLRHCEHCGGALPTGAYPKTKYHKRCAQTVKKEQQRVYARAFRLAGEGVVGSKSHRANAAARAAKELDLAGIDSASRRVGRRLVEVIDEAEHIASTQGV